MKAKILAALIAAWSASKKAFQSAVILFVTAFLGAMGLSAFIGADTIASWIQKLLGM